MYAAATRFTTPRPSPTHPRQYLEPLSAVLPASAYAQTRTTWERDTAMICDSNARSEEIFPGTAAHPLHTATATDLPITAFAKTPSQANACWHSSLNTRASLGSQVVSYRAGAASHSTPPSNPNPGSTPQSERKKSGLRSLFSCFTSTATYPRPQNPGDGSPSYAIQPNLKSSASDQTVGGTPLSLTIHIPAAALDAHASRHAHPKACPVPHLSEKTSTAQSASASAEDNHSPSHTSHRFDLHAASCLEAEDPVAGKMAPSAWATAAVGRGDAQMLGGVELRQMLQHIDIHVSAMTCETTCTRASEALAFLQLVGLVK